MGRRKNFKDGDTSSDLIVQDWVSVAEYGNFKLLKMKDSKASITLPPYSSTPSRIYGIMDKDNRGIKEIRIYNSDKAGQYRIDYGHKDHHAKSPHIHDMFNKNKEIEFSKYTNEIKEGFEKWVESIKKKNF